MKFAPDAAVAALATCGGDVNQAVAALVRAHAATKRELSDMKVAMYRASKERDDAVRRQHAAEQALAAERDICAQLCG